MGGNYLAKSLILLMAFDKINGLYTLLRSICT